MKLNLVSVSLIFGLSLAGCDDVPTVSFAPQKEAPPTSQPPAQADPVAELKKHLAHNGTAKTTELVWTDLKYDVKKTDSLVSPYEGAIEVNASVAGNEGAALIYSVALAYGDSGWRIADLRVSMGGMSAKTYTPQDDPNSFYELFRKQFDL